MVEVYDISEWSPHPWLNTGGTRDKKFVQSPEGSYYYFKTSLLRPNKDYRYEFWNEIIAHQLGLMLGFSTLKYDIGLDVEKIGCLSQSMIDNDLQDLIEGGKYIQAYDNSFDPEDTTKRKKYSFQLIQETFNRFELNEYFTNFLEVLVFDSIIGNGDRHQENWAFISDLGTVGVGLSVIDKLIKYEYDNSSALVRWLLRFYKDKKDKKLRKEIQDIKITLSRPKEFAPIYDNGSSLGRELLDEKVLEFLRDESKILKYMSRGKSEIHWENRKLSHFDLLKNISKVGFKDSLIEIIERVTSNYDKNNLVDILNSIDKKLSHKYISVKLPENRKELILKMIDLRIEKLRALEI